MDGVLERLENVTTRLERALAKSGRGGGDDGDGPPPYVAEWKMICDNEFKELIATCKLMKIMDCGNCIKKAVGAITAVLPKTATCKKPSGERLMEFLSALKDSIEKAGKLKLKRDKRKAKDRGNHRAAINEAVLAMSWPTVEPMTVPHIETQIDSCQFSINRVLKNDKDDDTRAWAKALPAFLKAVLGFVKENFKTGLEWRGKAELEASAAAPAKDEEKSPEKPAKKKSPAKAAAAAAPAKDAKPAAKKPTAGNMASVMGQLNKGLKVTSGLKKVTKDQKTKYRKKDERSGLVKTKAAAKKTKPNKKPITEQKGDRWNFFDHFEGIVPIPDGIGMKSFINISDCQDCAFEFKGKVKAISLNNLKKASVYIDSVVSSVEMVNCKSVYVYVRGNIPSIQIDKCESPQVVVLPGAKYPKLVISQVQAGNVEIPKPTKDDPDGTVEFPMPEQFDINILENKSGLSCEPVSHG